MFSTRRGSPQPFLEAGAACIFGMPHGCSAGAWVAFGSVRLSEVSDHYAGDARLEDSRGYTQKRVDRRRRGSRRGRADRRRAERVLGGLDPATGARSASAAKIVTSSTDGRHAGRKGPRCHPDHRRARAATGSRRSTSTGWTYTAYCGRGRLTRRTLATRQLHYGYNDAVGAQAMEEWQGQHRPPPLHHRSKLDDKLLRLTKLQHANRCGAASGGRYVRTRDACPGDLETAQGVSARVYVNDVRVDRAFSRQGRRLIGAIGRGRGASVRPQPGPGPGP